jgi:hypothetical protein
MDRAALVAVISGSAGSRFEGVLGTGYVSQRVERENVPSVGGAGGKVPSALRCGERPNTTRIGRQIHAGSYARPREVNDRSCCTACIRVSCPIVN